MGGWWVTLPRSISRLREDALPLPRWSISGCPQGSSLGTWGWFCHLLRYRSHSQVMAALCSLQPTNPARGWIVFPFGANPWWVCLVSAVPAILVTILIFMDQQITAVILNRREYKLQVSV